MSQESLYKGSSLRDAIFADSPLVEGQADTSENRASRIFDFAIQLFKPLSGDPEKTLEQLYGDRLGKSGNQLLREVKSIAVNTWVEMGPKHRGKYNKDTEIKIEEFMQELSEK